MKEKKIFLIIGILAALIIAGVVFAIAGNSKKEVKHVNFDFKRAGITPSGDENNPKKLIIKHDMMKNMIKINPQIFLNAQKNQNGSKPLDNQDKEKEKSCTGK